MYICTCPDFTKTQSAILHSSWGSELIDRDWTNSKAGATECKHIAAVRLYLGEEVDVPDDAPPEPEPPRTKSRTSKKWPPAVKGVPGW